jgi:hypothetical protein
MRRLPRKRRTREHVIADLSLNYVERQALVCGFVVDRITHDYGLDLELVTFNSRGEVEEGTVLIQLKASDHLGSLAGKETFSFPLDRRDLVYWLAQPMPVVLIVYDARKDAAYWLYIQHHFRRLQGFNLFAAGRSVSVQVPVTNVLDPAAVRRFARFRDRVVAQMKGVVHEDE